MTHEDSAKLARGRGQWMMTALGDTGEELAQTSAALNLLWVGDVATKDGLRIRSYRELQWAGVTPTGKDTKKWYEVIRHALCKDGDETAMLLEKFRTPPMAPDVNGFGLCWWTQQELEEIKILRANDGSICPTVRVGSTERGVANVSIWSVGGDTTMQPSCRLGNMEGIDIDRLAWIVGHTESDGLHAFFNVGYTGQRMRKRMMRKSDIDNAFDLLIKAAKRLCETQFYEDSDSDASTDDGYVPPGVEVDRAISVSDGSAYEGKGEEVRLVGAAAARFFWDVRPGEPGRSDSELQRDAVQNVGLPPWMQANRALAELEHLKGP